MTKYLTLLLISAGLITGIYTVGYYKGKHSAEQKQLEVNYKQLQQELAKHVKSESESLNIIENYHKELNTKDTTINNLKEQLANEKQYINATNRITTDWLWYIQSAATGDQISSATSRANASAKEVKADGVADSIIDNYRICHENAIQLEKLQAWIKAQQKIYNDKQ